MKIEKLVNSRINRIADWIIRLVMINILMIFTSLLIVTIYPSISAGYNMFHDYINQKNPRLFKDYFGYFKEHVVRKSILTIVIVFLLYLGVTNIMYYNQNIEIESTVFMNIGYFVMVSLLAILYAVILFSIPVMKVKPSMKYTSLAKLSFYLAGKHYLLTMLLVVTMSVPGVLFFFPRMFPVIVFAGVSIPVCLHAFITNGVVHYLESIGDHI